MRAWNSLSIGARLTRDPADGPEPLCVDPAGLVHDRLRRPLVCSPFQRRWAPQRIVWVASYPGPGPRGCFCAAGSRRQGRTMAVPRATQPTPSSQPPNTSDAKCSPRTTRLSPMSRG